MERAEIEPDNAQSWAVYSLGHCIVKLLSLLPCDDMQSKMISLNEKPSTGNVVFSLLVIVSRVFVGLA